MSDELDEVIFKDIIKELNKTCNKTLTSQEWEKNGHDMNMNIIETMASICEGMPKNACNPAFLINFMHGCTYIPVRDARALSEAIRSNCRKDGRTEAEWTTEVCDACNFLRYDNVRKDAFMNKMKVCFDEFMNKMSFLTDVVYDIAFQYKLCQDNQDNHVRLGNDAITRVREFSETFQRKWSECDLQRKKEEADRVAAELIEDEEKEKARQEKRKKKAKSKKTAQKDKSKQQQPEIQENTVREDQDPPSPLPGTPAQIASNVAAVEEKQRNECVICMDASKTHACVPCGHKCLCLGCRSSITTQCPICCADVLMVIPVHDV